MIDTYKTLCTEFYDLDKPAAPKEALEYYLREAKKSAQPVLEPMCGSGRFLIPFLEQGYDIEGTDASPEMIESCKKKCREKNLTPVLYYQKIQELKLPGMYGLIFIPSGSFGLITEDKDVKESLRRIHDCLLPDGKLILEIDSSYTAAQEDRQSRREVIRDNSSGIILTSKTKFDINTKIEITEYVYQNIVNDKLISAETETIKVRHYQISEFADLLKSAGFSETTALKPYSDEKAEEGDELILFKCVKPAG